MLEMLTTCLQHNQVYITVRGQFQRSRNTGSTRADDAHIVDDIGIDILTSAINDHSLPPVAITEHVPRTYHDLWRPWY